MFVCLFFVKEVKWRKAVWQSLSVWHGLKTRLAAISVRKRLSRQKDVSAGLANPPPATASLTHQGSVMPPFTHFNLPRLHPAAHSYSWLNCSLSLLSVYPITPLLLPPLSLSLSHPRLCIHTLRMLLVVRILSVATRLNAFFPLIDFIVSELSGDAFCRSCLLALLNPSLRVLTISLSLSVTL